MSHYDDIRDLHENKQPAVAIKAPTFEENVSKLLQLSPDKFKVHYENQIATYTEYVQYLKQTDGEQGEIDFFNGLIAKNQECVAYVTQNNVLTTMCDDLRLLWSEGDVLKMIAFQDHCTELMNAYFKNMEQMVQIDKYIDDYSGEDVGGIGNFNGRVN